MDTKTKLNIKTQTKQKNEKDHNIFCHIVD